MPNMYRQMGAMMAEQGYIKEDPPPAKSGTAKA